MCPDLQICTAYCLQQSITMQKITGLKTMAVVVADVAQGELAANMDFFQVSEPRWIQDDDASAAVSDAAAVDRHDKDDYPSAA